MADVVENKDQVAQETLEAPVQATPEAPVLTVGDAVSDAQSLAEKSDDELEAMRQNFSSAIDSAKMAFGEGAQSIADGFQAKIDEIIAEEKKRSKEAEEEVQKKEKEVETDVESFWTKYGGKINEGAKWAVLAAIVYRLFIF